MSASLFSSGYSVPSTALGLQVSIGPGSNTVTGATVNYLGSTLTMAVNATTFGYIDPSTGLLAVNTTGFSVGQIPIFIAVADSTQVTTITDARVTFTGSAGSLGSVPITSATSFGISVLASGDNALYTVPAGKCALVRIFVFNSTAGAITVFPTITPVGGAPIFKVGNNVALTASGANGSDTTYQTEFYMIFNPGDVVGLNATALGVNAHGLVLLFDLNNSGVFKQVILKTFVIGDNLLYTVPTGKVAYVASASFAAVGQVGSQILYSNESGGNTTISINAVPFGGSVSTANRIFAPGAQASGAQVSFICIKKMASGDFLSINTNANGKQFVVFTVLETNP